MFTGEQSREMLVGKGREVGELTSQEVYDISAQALSEVSLADKRVLVIVPDHSRRAPIDLFFRVIFDTIGGRVRALDYLIALGTHPPMSIERTLDRVGITAEEHKEKYAVVRFLNHNHDNPEELRVVGKISADDVSFLTSESPEERRCRKNNCVDDKGVGYSFRIPLWCHICKMPYDDYWSS